MSLANLLLDNHAQLPPALVAELRNFRTRYAPAEPGGIDFNADPRRYVKLAASIIDDIGKGALKPGDQVPSRARLKADYGVSVTTAAKAVRLLASHDLVERDGNAYWICGNVVMQARSEEQEPLQGPGQ